MSKAARRPGAPNTAYVVGRGIQLLAFAGGSVAVVMTLAVMPDREQSTAPALGVALLSGAVFLGGWLIQRHLGRGAGPER